MMCIFVGGSDGEALGMICIRGSYSKNKAFSSQNLTPFFLLVLYTKHHHLKSSLKQRRWIWWRRIGKSSRQFRSNSPRRVQIITPITQLRTRRIGSMACICGTTTFFKPRSMVDNWQITCIKTMGINISRGCRTGHYCRGM